MRTLAVVAAVASLVACSREPSHAPGPPSAPSPPPPRPVTIDAMAGHDAMTTPPIEVALDVAPLPVTMANHDQVMVRVTVTNRGSRVLDPELGLSELRVNGAVSKAWGLALNNSGHPRTWRALPPGEQVSARYQLGGELFPAPGDYTLELVVSGVAAPPVQVHVAD